MVVMNQQLNHNFSRRKLRCIENVLTGYPSIQEDVLRQWKELGILYENETGQWDNRFLGILFELMINHPKCPVALLNLDFSVAKK
jgi:hypothetical protein